MLMKLKNKYALSLTELISQTKARGGVPLRIEIGVGEAIEIIREWNENKDDSGYVDSFVAYTNNDLEYSNTRVDPNFIVNQNILTDLQIAEFCDTWLRKEYVITYNEVPVEPIRKLTPPTTSK